MFFSATNCILISYEYFQGAFLDKKRSGGCTFQKFPVGALAALRV